MTTPRNDASSSVSPWRARRSRTSARSFASTERRGARCGGSSRRARPGAFRPASPGPPSRRRGRGDRHRSRRQAAADHPATRRRAPPPAPRGPRRRTTTRAGTPRLSSSHASPARVASTTTGGHEAGQRGRRGGRRDGSCDGLSGGSRGRAAERTDAAHPRQRAAARRAGPRATAPTRGARRAWWTRRKSRGALPAFRRPGRWAILRAAGGMFRRGRFSA